MISRVVQTRRKQAAAMWIGAALAASAVAASAPRPKLVCPEPVCRFTERDLEAGSIRHTFRLRNDGGVSVEILRVESRCGCTDINLSHRFIPAGAEATLSVTLNLRGREGEVERALRVHSSDPETPTLDLRFEGSVAPEVEFRPMAMMFGEIPEQGSVTQSVEVVFAAGITNRVIGATSDRESFHAWLTELEPGRRYLVEAANRPEVSLPGGFLRASIALRTERPTRHPLEIPVRAVVMDELLASPRELIIPADEPGPLTLYASVRPGRIRAFRILEVLPPDPRIRAEVHPMDGGYRIHLRQVPVEAALGGRELVLKTDAPSRPEIRIPFRYGGPARSGASIAP